jgi:hypothetical protein
VETGRPTTLTPVAWRSTRRVASVTKPYPLHRPEAWWTTAWQAARAPIEAGERIGEHGVVGARGEAVDEEPTVGGRRRRGVRGGRIREDGEEAGLRVCLGDGSELELLLTAVAGTGRYRALRCLRLEPEVEGRECGSRSRFLQSSMPATFFFTIGMAAGRRAHLGAVGDLVVGAAVEAQEREEGLALVLTVAGLPVLAEHEQHRRRLQDRGTTVTAGPSFG